LSTQEPSEPLQNFVEALAPRETHEPPPQSPSPVHGLPGRDPPLHTAWLVTSVALAGLIAAGAPSRQVSPFAQSVLAAQRRVSSPSHTPSDLFWLV
jgi:hypothetical protein